MISEDILDPTNNDNLLKAYDKLLPIYNSFETKLNKKNWFTQHIKRLKKYLDNEIIEETIVNYLVTAATNYLDNEMKSTVPNNSKTVIGSTENWYKVDEDIDSTVSDEELEEIKLQFQE